MNEEFLELIRLLNEHGVDFILVGGYAYIFNAEARYTGDIDLWVRPERDNLERLAAASEAFLGARFDVAEVLGLLDTPHLGFTLAGVPPSRIEILLRLSGLDFDRASSRARLTEDGDIHFRVLDPHDQIRNKRAAGRDKDLADVKNLVKLHGEPPD